MHSGVNTIHSYLTPLAQKARGVLFLILFCLRANAACTVTDDIGHIIHLNKPAQRIISLAPDITENLFAIGAGNNIVGVIQGSDYLLAAKDVTQVGSYAGIDLEKIIALHPDLIVSWNNTFLKQINALKQFGIPIYTTNPRYLEDIPRTLKNLACLTGYDSQGQIAANKFTQDLAILRAKYQAKKRISVFYQIGSYALITINKDSWINQAIDLCGGKNVFANMHFIAPEVTWEAVILANPQVIITDASNADWKERWQQWQQITAVKQQLLFSIDADLLSRAGPRLLEGTQQLCRDLELARG